MHFKKLFLLLGAELILITVFLTTADTLPSYFSALFAFPFEQIGIVIRY